MRLQDSRTALRKPVASSGPCARDVRSRGPCRLLAAFVALRLLLHHETAAANAQAPPTADNPNSVVQIDFSRRFSDIEIPPCAADRVVNVTLADQEIACLLPPRRSSGLAMLDGLQQFLSHSPEADPEATLISDLLSAPKVGEDGQAQCKMPSRLSTQLHVGSPELQSYLRAARLRWLLDRCFRFSDIGVDDWRYELCIGRKVTLYKGNALAGKTIGRNLFELGTYNASLDQMWADGTMTQWYVGGTEGRQTEVLLVCGDSHPRVKGIWGPDEGKYRVWLEAPMFCDYRENASQPVSKGRGWLRCSGTDEGGQRGISRGCIKVWRGRRLVAGEGCRLATENTRPYASREGCTETWGLTRRRTAQSNAAVQVFLYIDRLVDATDGWWSYEYCHPDSLIEYHKEPNGNFLLRAQLQTAILLFCIHANAGELKGPLHLLGTLHASGNAAEIIFKRPNPLNPTLRGTDTLPPRSDGVPRYRYLPVEIVDKPRQFSKNPTPPSNKVLALQLSNTRPVKRSSLAEGRAVGKICTAAAEKKSDLPAGLRSQSNRDHRIRPLEGRNSLGRRKVTTKGWGSKRGGTVCEGTDIQRSARVLFECPVDFPLLSTHRIVHIEETSFCTYDLVIQTPLVCPHPKLLPPRPLDPQPILAYPTGRTFEHSVILASWTGLPAQIPTKEAEAPKTTPQANATLEAVPEDVMGLFQTGDGGRYFGLASYVRKRVSIQEPRFAVGKIVRHRWWQYLAVVLSWDASCKADDAWSNKVYAVYPKELQSTPHYLLLIDTKAGATKGWPLYAYVPEAALEPLQPNIIQEVEHPSLDVYFKKFSNLEGQYVARSEAGLANSFPDDVFL
ncbi:ubiquitin carboxyl-terminal [Cyclospora cayetanensis]|uniref:Ubiquitin carboxyl-terminal n=1 Tax=Cyclospora cayetanensis TaxID=88456 RepID=A0A1D3D9G9_9EIME|nr:ubiquitin carboxyl-terminal [Cyclospora cayetanensis]